MNSLKATEAESPVHGHKQTMERMYRVQRHFYDFTRRYYLLGRDRLIYKLAPPRGGTILEIGCGTGRNLVKTAENYPDARLFGVDISDEMLKSAGQSIARHGLEAKVRIAQADALSFNPERVFGRSSFDRIYFSYTLSMIPDWETAIRHAMTMLSEDGELHIVDFGQSEKLPGICKSALFSWLRLLHVSPRSGLQQHLQALSHGRGMKVHFDSLYRGFAWHLRAS